MELLPIVKQKYLLEASLEVLHLESLSWLSSINFWEDETWFYKNLINNKLFGNIEQKDKNNINTLLDQMISEGLSKFKREVSLHEITLNTLLQTKQKEQDFRDTHKELLLEFTALEHKMNQVKRSAFELLRLINQNFFNGNETLNTIYERRAVRKYKNSRMDKLTLEKIINAGKMAPTALNRQSWKFYVLTNKNKIERYAGEIMEVVEGIYPPVLLDHLKEMSVFHHAPAVIFITSPKNDEWSSLDVGMCAQNMMLAARSMGYDSCPVGFGKLIEKTRSAGELGLGENEEVKIAITLGLANEKPVMQERKQNNIIHLG